jgi:hypothetical protein
MKKLFLLSLFLIAAMCSFGQFTDTAQLGAFVRDTIKDRRPDKVTAAQLQKALLGTKSLIENSKPQVTQILSDTTTDPDFEIAIFPDIQNMIRYAQADSRTMFQWLKDNRVSKNIKAMLQVGDVTDWNTNAEWDTLDNQLSLISSTGLPYLFVPGNHDYGNGFNPSGRDATKYNAHIGVSHFTGKTFYKGHFGTTNENYFITFEAGSRKYVAVGLEFIPRDTVLSWAGHILDSIYAADPTREAIIVTHAYITAWNERATDTAYYSGNTYAMGADNSGQEIWEKLVRKKANIKWVFSGHYLIPGVWAHKGLHGEIVSVGDNGNLINQIMINYQDDDNHGDGYFLRLQFKPSKGTVDAKYFSSVTNAFDSRISSYTLDDPAVTVKSSLAVTGNSSFGKDVRITGTLKVESLEKGGVPVIYEDTKLKTFPGLRYDANYDSLATGKLRLKKNFLGSNLYPYLYAVDSNNAIIYEQRSQVGTLFMGIGAGAKHNLYGASYAEPNVIAIGNGAFGNSEGGWRMTVLGSGALHDMPGTNFPNASVVIGTNAGYVTTTISDANLFGNNAASGATVIQASVINGSDAGYSATNLRGSALFGAGAGRGVTGNGLDSATLIGTRTARNSTTAKRSVVIGSHAGLNETNLDDRLWIHNSGASVPLIYGEFNNMFLKINGDFRVTDSAQFNAVKIVDGSQANGKVLTSDANGNATWQTPSGGGGSIGGSIASTQVPVGSGSNTISGSSALTFDAAGLSITPSSAYGGLTIKGASNTGFNMEYSGATTGTLYTSSGNLNFLTPSGAGMRFYSNGSGAPIVSFPAAGGMDIDGITKLNSSTPSNHKITSTNGIAALTLSENYATAALTYNYGTTLGVGDGNISAACSYATIFNAQASGLMVGPSGTATTALDVNADKIRLRTAKTPSSATDTGNQGDIAWDASFIYVCIATNTWKRVAIATW